MRLRKRTSRKSYVDVNFVGDFGKIEKSRFTMEFKVLDKEQTVELLENAADEDIEDIEIIKDNAVGWDDVQDEDGNDLEFTPENIELLMKDKDIYKAIMSAFMDDLLGKKDRVKK